MQYIDNSSVDEIEDKKAVLVHGTPREAKAVYPTDWYESLVKVYVIR